MVKAKGKIELGFGINIKKRKKKLRSTGTKVTTFKVDNILNKKWKK